MLKCVPACMFNLEVYDYILFVLTFLICSLFLILDYTNTSNLNKFRSCAH